MTWLPIETAPKDGRAVMLYGGDGCFGYTPPPDMADNPVSISFWSNTEKTWIEATGEQYERHIDPTHWKPLPEPPK